MEIVDLMKRTLPSAKAKLAPPGWLLLAFWYSPPSVPPPVKNVQASNGYWSEDGGTIVLNIDTPAEPVPQRHPLLQPLSRVAALYASMQVCRSCMIAAGLERASKSPRVLLGGS